jgi:hypothetical protein
LPRKTLKDAEYLKDKNQAIRAVLVVSFSALFCDFCGCDFLAAKNAERRRISLKEENQAIRTVLIISFSALFCDFCG